MSRSIAGLTHCHRLSSDNTGKGEASSVPTCKCKLFTMSKLRWAQQSLQAHCLLQHGGIVQACACVCVWTGLGFMCQNNRVRQDRQTEERNIFFKCQRKPFNASLEISALQILIVMGGAALLVLYGYYVNWGCNTSPPPPGTLADGVRELIELQVHSRAAWEVGEALSLSNVVLHFLQVGEQWCLLRRSAGEFGLLHGDADWALIQRPLSHAERLQKRTDILVFQSVTSLMLQMKRPQSCLPPPFYVLYMKKT